MKKIIVILCLLCLYGCTNQSLQKACQVIINIEGEVIPNITVSNGEYNFNAEKKQLIIKTDSISPIDVSLSHNDYNPVNIYFTTKDLMERFVERTVFFGEEKQAKISLSILSSAPAWDITISGVEFKRSLKTFSANVTRNQDVTIKVTGGEEFREVDLNISKEDLVTGTYTKDIILPRKDEAIIYFKSNIQGISVSDYETKFKYRITPYDGGYYCLVNKGVKVIITNRTVTNYYKLTEDIYYDNSELDTEAMLEYNFLFGQIPNVNSPANSLYYIKNNRLVKINIPTYGSRAKIPIGAQLVLIYPNLTGGTNIRYRYQYNPSMTNISISNGDFNEPQELIFDARFYDRLAKEYLSEVNYDGELKQADNDFFFNDLKKLPALDNYTVPQFNYNNLCFDDGKFILEMDITLQDAEYIINFVNTKNVPVKVMAMNADCVEIEVGKYAISSLEDKNIGALKIYEADYSFPLRIQVNNHWLDLNKEIYAEMFSKVNINDKVYFELAEPIIVNPEIYTIKLGFDNYFSSYGTMYIYHNDITYTNLLGFTFTIPNAQINDKLLFDLPAIERTFEITLTKEILDDGFAIIDVYNEKILINQTYRLHARNGKIFTNRTYNIISNGTVGSFKIINDSLAEFTFMSNAYSIKILYLDVDTNMYNFITFILNSYTYDYYTN